MADNIFFLQDDYTPAQHPLTINNLTPGVINLGDIVYIDGIAFGVALQDLKVSVDSATVKMKEFARGVNLVREIDFQMKFGPMGQKEYDEMWNMIS